MRQTDHFSPTPDQVNEWCRNLVYHGEDDPRDKVNADYLAMIESCEAGDAYRACWFAYRLGRRDYANSVFPNVSPENTKEAIRKYKQRHNRKADAQAKIDLCHKELAKFSSAEIERAGMPMVRRDIGKFVAETLKLGEPIPEDSVRKYLKMPKSGNDSIVANLHGG